MLFSRNSERSETAPRLGYILMGMGKLTEEQLREGIEIQESDGRPLGKILVALGAVSSEDLARAIAVQLNLEYVSLFDEDVDPEAVDRVPLKVLQQHGAIPIRFENEHLIVAMSSPNNLRARSDITIHAESPIIPVVAAEDAIHALHRRMFGEDYEELEPDEGVDYGDGPGRANVNSGDRPARGGGDRGSGRNRDDSRSPSSLVRSSRVRRFGGDQQTKIGNVLVKMGTITEENLGQALAIQKDSRQPLGKILRSLGLVTEADLAKALASRLRLDYINLAESDVDRGAASLVEQKVLRKHGVLPLRIEDGRLIVAMSDPTNIHAFEDLRIISGYPVSPVVALEEDIQRVHNKVFAVGDEVNEILQEAAGDVGESADVLDLGLEVGTDEAPIIRLVSSILQQAIGDNASDIHIEPRAKELTVRMRVDGVLRETMSIPPKLQSGTLARLKILGSLDIAERRLPQDGRFSIKLGGQKIDIRVAALPTVYGEKIVLRLLDSASVEADLKKLGFAPKIFEKYQEIFQRPYGAILVTGPTGSGKSTTLYATLSELNSPEKNIITVEDPVELKIPGVNQVQVNTRAGLTFASGLRSILRSDPDIVMIGEIRDFETAKISVEAALTGHMVLATLHTNNAPSALGRLTDMGVEPFLTTSAVDCVIAQRLARRLCENCKEPVEIEDEILSGMQFPFELLSKNEKPTFHKAVGCDRCGDSGYRGRVGIYELMAVNEEIRDLLLKRAPTNDIASAAERNGMIRLREDGLLKAAQGVTTIEEVLRTVV